MRWHSLLEQYSFNVFMGLAYAKYSGTPNSDVDFYLFREYFQKKISNFWRKIAVYQNMFVPLFWTFYLTNL